MHFACVATPWPSHGPPKHPSKYPGFLIALAHSLSRSSSGISVTRLHCDHLSDLSSLVLLHIRFYQIFASPLCGVHFILCVVFWIRLRTRRSTLPSHSFPIDILAFFTRLVGQLCCISNQSPHSNTLSSSCKTRVWELPLKGQVLLFCASSLVGVSNVQKPASIVEKTGLSAQATFVRPYHPSL